MNAKKILLLFITCFFIVTIINAQDDSKDTVSSISFFDPFVDTKVPTNQDALKQFVRAQMESFVTNYSSITVDSGNEKQILEYQQQNDGIESGKMDFASYITNTKITKLGDNNILSIEIDDATKGTIRASATQSFTNAQLNSNDQLTNVIGTLMSDILQQLNVKLTSYQIDCMKGNSNISDATSANLQQIIDSSNIEIASLDAKLASLKSASNNTNASELAKLQARHDKLVLKTKDNERRLAQKIADEKKVEEEKVAAAQRTDELNQTINKQKKEYEKKAAQLRSANLRSMKTDDQIAAIEQNKQFIISIREECAANKSSFAEKTNTNAANDISENTNKPYRQAEKDKDGNPIAEALQKRTKKNNEIRAKADKDIATYNETQNKIQSDTETKLMKEIFSNYSDLKTKQSISSLDDTSLLRINNYDGNVHGWSSQIDLWIDGTEIANYEILVPYTTLTGKKINTDDQDYLDTVEEYDSYFRSNIPIVYAIVEYTVEPAELSKPSTYIVTILNTTLYNIETQKKIKSESYKNLTGAFTVLPTKDIRTDEQRQHDDLIAEKAKETADREAERAQQKEDEDYQKELDKQKKNLEAQKKKLAAEERRAEAKEKALIFFSPAKHGGIEGGVKYANIGSSNQTSAYFGAIDIPVSKIFIGAEVTGWNISYTPSSSSHVTDNYGNTSTITTPSSINIADATWDVGGRIGIHFTWLKKLFSPYFAVGGGYEFNGSFTPMMYYIQGTAGCHLLYLFDVAYNCRYTADGELNHSLGLSIAINGPWFSNK